MPTASGGPDWEDEGRDWPFRSESRFVRAGGLLWHVQQLGSGPSLLMLHGTGAATHTWRELAPLLSPHFALTMIDLPGHGFTEMPLDGPPGLEGMSLSVSRLLTEIGVDPVHVVGHSASVAILARMCLDGRIAPRTLCGINSALMPFSGVARLIPPTLARLLFANPLVVGLTARRGAGRAAVARLLEGTGSHIDPRGLDLYARLFGSPRHVRAALGMMAAWRLEPLVRDLPHLKPRLVLIVSGGDLAVPAEQAFEVRAKLPSAEVHFLRGLGHLAHEESARAIAPILIDRCLSDQPLPGSTTPGPDDAS